MTTDWPSARARIRHTVVELLKARVPAVRGRVFRGRTWPLQVREMPGLLVYAWQEDKKSPPAPSTARASYDVELTLAVEIRVAEASRAEEQAEAVEDELEELAGMVTDVVMQAPELIGLQGPIERIEGVRTTFGINGRDAEQTLGRALLAFDLRFKEQYRLLSLRPPASGGSQPPGGSGGAQPPGGVHPPGGGTPPPPAGCPPSPPAICDEPFLAFAPRFPAAP